MKIFGWMQNKLNGKQANGKSSAAVPVKHQVKQEPVKEEFSDWPHGLLAIGTFGNNVLKENTGRQQIQEEEEEDSTSSEELADFTPEEVVKLQKELMKLLTRKPRASNAEKETADLPLDKFLNCPSSLEVERRIRESFRSIGSDVESLNNGDEEDIEKTISAIIGKCRYVCAEKNKKSIGKKSISFLLKKMFVCRGGFMPTPSLRDTLQQSRMEKLLRTMLHKKMQSQYPTRSSSVKRYLEDKRMSKSGREEETQDHRSSDRCKWVKTDSEFIVLEM